MGQEEPDVTPSQYRDNGIAVYNDESGQTMNRVLRENPWGTVIRFGKVESLICPLCCALVPVTQDDITQVVSGQTVPMAKEAHIVHHVRMLQIAKGRA